MAFVQAGIAVENQEMFDRLRNMIEKALDGAEIDRYLKSIAGKGLLVRDFESILKQRLFDKFGDGQPPTPTEIYKQLSISDQGQIRELYLTKIEEVDGRLRDKYQRVYRYA